MKKLFTSNVAANFQALGAGLQAQIDYAKAKLPPTVASSFSAAKGADLRTRSPKAASDALPLLSRHRPAGRRRSRRELAWCSGEDLSAARCFMGTCIGDHELSIAKQARSSGGGSAPDMVAPPSSSGLSEQDAHELRRQLVEIKVKNNMLKQELEEAQDAAQEASQLRLRWASGFGGSV